MSIRAMKLTSADGERQYYLNPMNVLLFNDRANRGTEVDINSGISVLVQEAPDEVAEEFRLAMEGRECCKE